MMDFGIYTYLVSILAFAGSAAIIEVLFLRKELRNHFYLLCVMFVLALVFTFLGESAALSTNAWVYNAQYMFNVRIFGAEAETYLYTILVAFAISIATLFCAREEEMGKSLSLTVWKKFRSILRF